MIKIYLLDFCGAEAAEKHLSALPSFLYDIKNPRHRRERIFSYLLLSYAYSEWQGEGRISPLPEILRDEYGRPHFSDFELDFNLSHDGNMTALVISDEGRVGIDIAEIRDTVSDRLIGMCEEHFKNMHLSTLYSSPDRLAAEVLEMAYSKADGIYKKGEKTVTRVPISDFFSEWTTLEAISKADGRGLALVKKIDFENKEFLLRRAAVTDKGGKAYALCVCKISEA